MRENENIREYYEADDGHKFVSESDAPGVSPSVAEGGTGLDLDFHHSEEGEFSEDDLRRLQEMNESFSDGENLSEEERLNQELESLTAESESRKQKRLQEQRLRELKSQVRKQKLQNKLAPVSGGIERLQDFLNLVGSGEHESQVGFGQNRQPFSLGQNKFDMSFGKSQGIEQGSHGGVSPSVKAGHQSNMFEKRDSAIQLGFGSHDRGISWNSGKRSGLSLGLNSGSGVSFGAMGQGMSLGQQKQPTSKKKSGKKAGKNKQSLDINLIIRGK